jgi:hypothetical protein
MPDEPRPVATDLDTSYSLSIEDAVSMYARAGHPRTPRTVQRYCASGHIECVKAATMLGDKYFVEPASVARHIAQIEELTALDNRAQGLGLSRHAAPVAGQPLPRDEARQLHQLNAPLSPPVADSNAPSDGLVASSSGENPMTDMARQQATAMPPTSRPAATETTDLSRHVAQLEKEVERLNDDKSFLRQQIQTKDEQIGALLERDRETNILVRGLQQMLSPLLGGPRSGPEPQTGFEN